MMKLKFQQLILARIVRNTAASYGGVGPAKMILIETGRRTFILLLVRDWFTGVDVRKL